MMKLVVDLSKPHGKRESYVDLTEAELAEAQRRAQEAPEKLRGDLRMMVDARLRGSDWTMLSDAGLSTADKAKWKAYRDDLRKMVAEGDPANPKWPVPPA
jgi:hypothetical protein